MVNVERDINKAKGGAGDELVYKTITGLKSDLSIESKPVMLQNNNSATENANEQGIYTNISLINVSINYSGGKYAKTTTTKFT